MDNEEVTRTENIRFINTGELDYMAHLQTLKEFEDLYDNMYIDENNECGKWILK